MIDLSNVPNGNIVLLLGAPRSGTTWLAKIFDSHPDVLYRHEPDIHLRDPKLQGYFTREQAVELRDNAHEYLQRLFAVRTVPVAGSLPTFRKNYYCATANAVRRGLVLGARVLMKAARGHRLVRQLPIPAMLPPERQGDVRLVMKSVISRARARLFAEALPGCHTVLIVRDPFGQVASAMRGAAMGKLNLTPNLDYVVDTPQAARYGLTLERFGRLSFAEKLAWDWVVFNEKAIEDLEDLPTARVIRYGDLCADPVGLSKELFAFTGLSWERQTEEFIRRSITPVGPDRYFRVFKNPTTSLNKWRSQMPREDQERVMAIVQRTRMREFCLPECLPASTGHRAPQSASPLLQLAYTQN